MTVTCDTLDRTIKLDLDTGRAASIEAAKRLAGARVLQLVVGDGVANSPTSQAALLTIVNAGSRAFHGGVRITGNLDWEFTVRWAAGRSVTDALTRLGGTITAPDRLNSQHPTVTVGHTDQCPPGSVRLYTTFDSWSGGVVANPASRLAEREFPLAGVLAGGLAVSEAFAHTLGSATAGHRDVGISLWDPELSWTDSDAAGPAVQYLPDRLWVLGLGHLGQAHLWAIGFLPYQDPAAVELWLVDYDRVVPANRSTGLLVHNDDQVDALKTRIAAGAMEQLGFSTRIVERAFDGQSGPRAGEPTWALAGFDAPEPRRHLGSFDVAVDLGIGASAEDFLGIHLHGFPAAGDPADIFARPPDTTGAGVPVARWAVDAAADVCGVVQIQNVAVGAAFVGAVAATVSVAELLRLLAGQDPTAVLSCSLAAPTYIDVARARTALRNPGYQRAS